MKSVSNVWWFHYIWFYIWIIGCTQPALPALGEASSDSPPEPAECIRMYQSEYFNFDIKVLNVLDHWIFCLQWWQHCWWQPTAHPTCDEPWSMVTGQDYINGWNDWWMCGNQYLTRISTTSSGLESFRVKNAQWILILGDWIIWTWLFAWQPALDIPWPLCIWASE